MGNTSLFSRVGAVENMLVENTRVPLLMETGNSALKCCEGHNLLLGRGKLVVAPHVGKLGLL